MCSTTNGNKVVADLSPMSKPFLFDYLCNVTFSSFKHRLLIPIVKPWPSIVFEEDNNFNAQTPFKYLCYS